MIYHCLYSKLYVLKIHKLLELYVTYRFIDFSPATSWIRLSTQRMNVSRASTVQAPIGFSCAMMCFHSDVCDCVNYRPSDQSCELLTLSDQLLTSYTKLLSDVNWEYWYPEYVNLV
jgi:PAN domain